MRLRALILVVLLLYVPVVASAPTPGADDAGSGGDAGDVPALALPIGAGNHGGTVSWAGDLLDYYLLDVPPRSMIRIEITGDWPVVASLYDPSGDQRGRTHTMSPYGMRAISDVGGEWILKVEAFLQSTGISTLSYTLRIDYEQHESAVGFEGGVVAANTFAASFPPGTFSAVEVRRLASADWQGQSTVSLKYSVSRVPGLCFGVTGVAVSDSDVVPDPLVWMSGDLPTEAAADLPWLVPTEASPLFPQWVSGRYIIESPTGDLTAYVGASSSSGLRMRAWLLWDGPGPTTADFIAGSQARFATLSDFDGGEGLGVGVGPYAAADGLTTSQYLPSDGVNVLYVTGEEPMFALEPTEFRLTPPDHPPLTLRNQYLFASTSQGLPDGRYGLEAVHADGLEQGKVRLAAANFPIPRGCP